MQWDIAGPETFLAITKSLYGGAVGIFIIYDTNNEVDMHTPHTAVVVHTPHKE